MPSEEFIAWADRHRGEVTLVSNMLRTCLPSEIHEVPPHLVAVDGWCSRMETLLGHAEEYLLKAQEDARLGLGAEIKHPRERWLKIRYEARLEQRVRDVIKGICHSMKSRLMLGMSVMKKHSTELAAQI